MDLRQAAYVVAVVDHGTFTAAAASIPVSQPALSQAIASLERELGTELFHRIGRQVVLTPAGEAFVEPARRMLRDAEIARAAVGQVAGLTRGRLDVVALPTLVVEPLVDLVGRFRAAHPNVLVRISEPEDADGVAALVRSGAAELGLGDAVPEDRSLATDRLGTQRLLAVLPPATPIPEDRPLAIARLAHFPLITTPRGTSTRRLLGAALRQADPDTDPHIGVVTEHREAIVPLVMFTRDRVKMGALVAPLWLTIVSGIIAAIIIALNVKLLYDLATGG